MSYELLFTVANATASLCWLPLVLAPRSDFTRRYTDTPAVPAIFGLLYVALLVVMFATPGEGGMQSLDALRTAFLRDPVLLLAWVHYLCFDMMVGFWELRDSRRLGLNPWLVAPCLVGTFAFGPFGLCLYLALRLAIRGTLRFEDGCDARRDQPPTRSTPAPS